MDGNPCFNTNPRFGSSRWLQLGSNSMQWDLLVWMPMTIVEWLICWYKMSQLRFCGCLLGFYRWGGKMTDGESLSSQAMHESMKAGMSTIWEEGLGTTIWWPDQGFSVLRFCFRGVGGWRGVLQWKTFCCLWLDSGCSLITDEELETILQLPILVVLDEAYIEFALEPSRMQWVKKFDNLVILRTFSKRAGVLFLFLWTITHALIFLVQNQVWRAYKIWCFHYLH